MWLLILSLLAAWLYLNQEGLPDFIKNPLLEKLRARGLDLQFSRLRLRWYEGFVAENVRFGAADDVLSPQLTLREMKLSLDLQALSRFKFQVESLTLRHGRLVVPVADTNGPAKQLSIENIQTNLRLLPNDQWALDQFTAGFAGAKIRLSGRVAHASAVRDWNFFSNQKPLPRAALQNRFRQLADTLERVHFSVPPELNLNLAGDAREPQSFAIGLVISAPDADTPWGAVTQGRFVARLLPADTNGISRAELRLGAVGARTTWGSTSNLQLVVHLAADEKRADVVDAHLVLMARNVQTPWGNAANSQFTADWIHALTNPVPLSGQGRFSCDSAETPLAGGASAKGLEVSARLSTPHPVSKGVESWGWWTNIAPYALDWECCLSELHSEKLIIETIAGAGIWRAPELTITNLEAGLYDGQLEANAKLDVATRALLATLTSTVDPHKVSPVLTEGARRWLDQFSWEQPPQVKAAVGLILPAWTNRHPDWRAEVQPGLNIEGAFSSDHGGAFRGVSLSAATSHFSYSNMVWRLPDLSVTRPEGRLLAFHQASDLTKDFYWRVKSSIDPKIVQPLFESNVQRHFDLVGLTEPPHLNAEIWGRFHEPDLVGFKGAIACTNFTFRGESISGLQTSFQYTNRVLLLTGAAAQLGTQQVSADGLGFDISAQKIYLTNGFSTADPQVVTRAIGPKIARTIEPYHFVNPPTAHVHGIIPTHNETEADLHFDVDGGPFQWSKFNLAHIVGHVHWKGDRLDLENVRSDFYNGTAIGSATFDFTPEHRTDFQFNLTVTNAVLQFLMADVATQTNALEGRISGTLVVNKANSTNWQSWQGGGHAELKQGLLWEIPIFGIFSPVLNTISPGLGSSPATSATGTFLITNGVVRSDDLEIRSPAMRLQYRGTVDFDRRVNARVDAELLRDMWLVGPFVSTVFWPVTKLFEYKVTGSLAQPKTEPVYLIPKLVMMPFHPFRSLKELLQEDSGPTRKKAPP